MIRSLTLIALAASVGLAAADGVTSIRLGLTGLPQSSDAEFTTTGGGPVISTAGKWDTASRFSISAYRNCDVAAPISFNLGAGLAVSAFDQYTPDGSSTAADVAQSQFGIFIEPGLAFNFGKEFAIEVGLPLGYGTVVYQEKFAGGNDFDGSYVEVGLLVRPVLTLQHFQIFAELGGLSQSSRIKDDVDNTLTFHTSGAMASLGVGVTF